MRAAAIQLQSGPDRDRNVAAADRLVRAAAAEGATLVVLPEKWTAFGRPEHWVAAAESLAGPTSAWACALAGELGIDLVAGSLLTEEADGSFNTCLHAGPAGELVATYRKIHLFDVQLGANVHRDSDYESAGDQPVLTHTADGVGVGLTVCYDLRFPELYRALAVAGARILSVASAFTLTTTRAEHWEVLLRARAIEDQCFVVAANQIGNPAPGIRTGGASMIVDPWGTVLARAPDEETFVIADLDFARQDEIRRAVPSLANRRDAASRAPEVVA